MKSIINPILRLTSRIAILIALAMLAAWPASGALVVWDGQDATNNVNTNWSDALNWSGGAPSSANGIFFNDLGAAPVVSNIDNIVDANTTILTLKIGNTNGFHTTLINPGVTLTVTNSASGNLVFVGTGTDGGASQIVDATVTGAGGTLVMASTNAGSQVIIQQGSGSSSSHNAKLDLSGLDTFNLSIGRLLVGGAPGSGINASNYLSGTLILAKTNLIQLNGSATPTLDLGDAISNGGPPNSLQLGQTNALFVGTMAVGRTKCTGTLQFNPSLAGNNPALYLRGINATTRVTTLAIGDMSGTSNSGSSSSGTVDLGLGTVDAQVNACYVGRGQTGPSTTSGTGTATGVLTLGAGVFNVNLLFEGYILTNSAKGSVTGTVNVTGTATLVVNTNLVLGANPGSTGTGTGNLNITNGTVLANAITSTNGNVNSTINMMGGTLVVSNTAGTPSAPITTVTLTSATLQLAASNTVANLAVSSLNLADNNSSINVSAIPVLFGYPSQLPLLSYATSTGGSTINLGTLPGTYKGYISNDMVSTVWLVVTNGPSTAKDDEWGGGVNNLWNTTTLNWTNAGVAVPYGENDGVTFDDLAKTGSVNLTATHTPLGLIVTNNVLNYTFTGVGSITGGVGLKKQGSASLTLTETGGDNFSGGVVVAGGTVILDDANCAISGGVGITNGATLQVGNNDANGALPTGALDDEGTLTFSRTDNPLLTTTIPGGGGLTQNGNGTLTLSAPVTYTGNTIIARGTLALTNAVSLSNSVAVLVSNATFDVSGLGGQTTVLNSLTVTNATFNVAISAGAQPPISVASTLIADGSLSVSNKINVLALPNVASYPVTLPIIQSAFISLAAGNFNFSLGSLPAGYVGSISESPDNTTVLLTLTSGPIGVRPNMTWSGADVPNLDTNWSDRLNWQLPGAPTPADNLVFSDTAAVSAASVSTPGGGVNAFTPDNINNIVDQNFAIASLTYTNLGATYHNTDLREGGTLTITNSLTAGGLDSGAAAQTGFVTISGAQATLSFTNPAGNVSVWNGSGSVAGSQATLDLSALDNFTVTASRLLVGASAGNTVNRPCGVLYLARTNAITAEYESATIDSGSTAADSGLVVGDCVSNAGNASTLSLGQVNVFTLDSIGIGRQKTSGNLSFNTIYANVAPYPSVIFQGFSANAVTLFEVGNGGGNTGTTTLTADVNLAGGWVTANIATLNIGRAAAGTSGTGTTTGSLEFDAGTITANTVNVGLQTVANTSKNGVGTLSVNANSTIGANATLSVSGSLNLAVNVNSTVTSGTLSINGGTVLANNIVAGANNVNSTVSLNGGLLVVTNTMGSPAAPLATLSLGGGTVQLNVNGNALVTNVVATTVNPSSQTTINIGAIANGQGVTTFPLISYTGTDPFASLMLGALPPGFAGHLVDNSANGRIDLNLTTVPTALVWVGAVGSTLNGNWNFGSANWQNLGAPSLYANPDFAQFDDTASNSTVTIATTVSPSEMNVTNNALNYAFSGSGSITGTASLTKSGSGTLTLAETGGDNFSGGITVNNNGGKLILDNPNSALGGNTTIGSAATVQVGNNDGNGALPSGTVTDNGSVVFERTNSLAVPGAISGTGNILQSGGGVLTLSGANSYTGGTVVNSGTLQLAYYSTVPNSPELGAGSGAITDNSILSITNGGGAPTYMLMTNTISGVGSINLPQNQEINFNGPGSLSGFTGTINIPPGATPTAKGDITSSNVNLSASAVINVASGGALWVGNSGTTVPATINVSGPGNGEGWGALRVDSAGIYSGPVHLLGNATIGAQNTSSGTISGVISDGGNGYSVTKLGAQTVILTGANTYGGGTTISNATLQIGNGIVNGTLPGNVNIAVTNTTLSFVAATNTTQTYGGVISGPGSLLENGFGGTLALNGLNTFTNGVTITSGALWITNAAALGTGPKLITAVNGTAGHPELHLNGVSGNILLPSTLSFLTSWIGGSGSQGVVINEAGNNEIDGNFTLTSGGGGSAFVVNGGTLKLAGNFAPNTTSRTLQFGGVGNGTVSGVIADAGTNLLTGITVVGPGTWTFAGNNTYVTNTTVSGGTLLVNGNIGSGGLTVQTNATLGGSGNVSGITTLQNGGAIQGGDVNYSNALTVGTLNLGNTNNVITYSRFTVAAGGKVAATSLNLSGTNVVQILDSNLRVGTNTLFTYSGSIGGSNGFGGFQLGTLPSGVTAQLLNSGSAVKLAVTSVFNVNTNSPVLTNSISGSTLTLAWPADHLGWRLQVQTNSLNAGLGGNWFTWPNSTNLTSVPIPLNPGNPTVFFRLVYP